jgi:hypothetical protein
MIITKPKKKGGEVEVRQLPHDFTNSYYIVRKG